MATLSPVSTAAAVGLFGLLLLGGCGEEATPPSDDAADDAARQQTILQLDDIRAQGQALADRIDALAESGADRLTSIQAEHADVSEQIDSARLARQEARTAIHELQGRSRSGQVLTRAQRDRLMAARRTVAENDQRLRELEPELSDLEESIREAAHNFDRLQSLRAQLSELERGADELEQKLVTENQ